MHFNQTKVFFFYKHICEVSAFRLPKQMKNISYFAYKKKSMLGAAYISPFVFYAYIKETFSLEGEN